MNNLQLIEKVLYYIDEHLCEELTYENAMLCIYFMSLKTRIPTEWENSNKHPH